MLLEVIVTGAEEARIAARAGADRLELVAGFEQGGLTPAVELVAEVAAAVDVPVHVMVRPHARGFHYREDELRAIEEVAAALRSAGAHGIVFGALDAAGDVELASVARVAAASGGLPMTFHRAFDETRDPLSALDALATVPAVTSVLTSGHAPDAWHGRHLLRTLIARGGRPAILIGSGITAGNLLSLVQATGATDVHVGNAARSGGRIDAENIRWLRTLLSRAERARRR
jgi:copper homeostasis protein